MPNRKIKIFIIAGEVSGDVIGASIMKEMPEIQFFGIGGENMIKAGLKSLFPMSDLSVMGVVEVLAHGKTLLKRINNAVSAIIETKPDIVLTIDSPGFAKSVIKKIRNMQEGKKLIDNGLRFYHFVAPQVWAWRAGRAKDYAAIFDKLYAFFDFEVPYFTKYGLNTIAVGHPIAARLIGKYKNVRNTNKEKIIALVPGSRMTEVKKLLPIFQEVTERLYAAGYIGYRFVIPTVETTKDYIIKHVKNWKIQPELLDSSERYDLYAKSYIAIVASGTVSAELAMLHIPTIVVYKMNSLTSWLIKQVIKVKWVSLVNILLRKTVYPEFLGSNAKADYIIDAIQQLTIPAVREKMIKELKVADGLWKKNNENATKLIAEDILKTLK